MAVYTKNITFCLPVLMVPERVTMSTGKQKVMFFVYTAITLIGAYLFATNI